MAEKKGMVVLVGAGPGDPELLTLAGQKWLGRADVVVYDRLAAPKLLDACRPEAEKIYVGKTPSPAGQDQERINALLIEQARAGKLVVRLKGGDPLIFGRGGEEAAALRAAGIDFRIVPGVTAAIAAGACAGIPLTDRHLASSVAFVTGHEDPAKQASAINWAALAGIDTVVFYMGVGSLADISAKLIAAGRGGEAPAAVVADASTPRQRTVVTTLAELPQAVAAAGIKPPAITIVGAVAALKPQIEWLERLPLFGRRIIVTRTRQQASELAARLTELGAEVIEAPAIEIRPAGDTAAIDACLRRLGEYDLVAFTSANGVRAFIEHCGRLGIDARAMARAKLAAIGPATAAALREHFLQPDIVPADYTSVGLGAALAKLDLKGRRVLLPRADIATETLPTLLRQAGAEVDEVAFYTTVCPESLLPAAAEAIAAGHVDWITFASSSCVTNFLALLAKSGLRLPPTSRLAAIGPVTAETLRQASLTVTAQAKEATVEALVHAIVAASVQ